MKLNARCQKKSVLVLGFIAAVTLAGWFCRAPVCAHGAEGMLPVGESTWEIADDSKIDRVIPSKAGDLFVVLKNGLTVLVRESRASSVVLTRVVVNTGSICEGERIPGGLSHYLEHVVSGGTTSALTESQIKERLQVMGGVNNAYTTYHQTAYFIKTTKAHYMEALSLLLSYVADCQFDETEHQREKGVILQEFQMGENDPSRRLWYLFMKTAYREHPVRYPVIGERQVFLEMEKEDLVGHYRRWYRPEHMIVAVVGDVEKNETLQTIINQAGSWERTPDPPYVLPAEPPQLGERRAEKRLPMARMTQAKMGFRTVPLTHPDLYALDVLAVIMGDGRMSRLYRKVRDEKGLVLSIRADSWTPTFVEGQFVISLDLSYENLPDAIDAVWQELSDFKGNRVSHEALAMAKTKVAARHVFSQETVQSQAAQLTSDWAATGDPYFSENYVSRIQEVGPEDLMRVARTYFRREGMTLAVIKPADAGSKTVSKQAEAAGLREGPQKIVLGNEMTVLLKRSTAAPVVFLDFVVEGGLRFEPADKPGLSRFMAALLTKGTRNRSKFEIAKAIEDVGGSIRSTSGNNTVSVSVSVLKEHLGMALDVLSDVVVHPAFPEEELDKERKETLLAIQRLDEQWTSEIVRLFKRHYYRKHPYRNDILGSAEAVRGFSRKDVIDFYESVVLPNNGVLAVYGDVDAAEAKTLIEEVFADFHPDVLKQPVIETETHNIERDAVFEVFNEKTSAGLLVGFNGMTLQDKDRPAVDVLDAIVSGINYPGGWLHDALRGGDRNLVYAVHAFPAFGVDGGFFGVMAQTTAENYDDVLDIILEKMALIAEVKVDPEILQRAKAMCLNAHEMDLEGMGAQAWTAAVNELLGLGFDYDRRYPELIAQVTAEDVLRVGKRLFSHHLVVATKPGRFQDASAD